MYTYCCLNNISQIGLKHFHENFEEVHETEPADAILVRSALWSLIRRGPMQTA